jgi:hypothetical protein
MASTVTARQNRTNSAPGQGTKLEQPELRKQFNKNNNEMCLCRSTILPLTEITPELSLEANHWSNMLSNVDTVARCPAEPPLRTRKRR